ncbi:MAG: class I SAM-dependent methyltransferase [Candidatus Aminicenantaceae bacterium]
MFKRIGKSSYELFHKIGYKTIKFNPLIPGRISSKKVKYGFISDDHLKNPALDEKLVTDLENEGMKVETYRINIQDFKIYLSRAQYPKTYHGGGSIRRSNFLEKSLEHFVSADLLEFTSEDVYIDIASAQSPFYKIVEAMWKPRTVYRQDLTYEHGIHGNTIGGNAGILPLPDNSISKATLHCSLEHFEGNSDIELFREMSRVLRPGGKLCVLPFYLASEYTIHTDPIYTLFFGSNLSFDPEAQIRYCSWNNRHSRHYDVGHLKTRIMPCLKGLIMKIYKVENFREVNSSCYLRFIGLFEKKS